MRKRRVRRGQASEEVPEVPDRTIFHKAFNLYYGSSAATWRWGELNADMAFVLIKDSCLAVPHPQET